RILTEMLVGETFPPRSRTPLVAFATETKTRRDWPPVCDRWAPLPSRSRSGDVAHGAGSRRRMVSSRFSESNLTSVSPVPWTQQEPDAGVAGLNMQQKAHRHW